MSFSGPLEDRIAIRERIDAYSDAVFRRDVEDWGANWAKDAIWDFAGASFEGRDTIVGVWQQAMSTFDYVAFFAFPGAIDVEGSQATCRVYTNEVLKEKGAEVLRRIEGVYEDTLCKENGAWCFTHRTYTILRDDAADS